MKTLETHLSQYAEYHRDRRNIATHFVGIPMIVLAVIIALSKPALDIKGAIFSAFWPVYILSCVFYLRLDIKLGMLMSLLLLLGGLFGSYVADLSYGVWLFAWLTLFIIGWVIQFIGHVYEGKKPAFVDDIIGLVIGPLFVVVEFLFMLGLLKNLKRQIEENVGPTR